MTTTLHGEASCALATPEVTAALTLRGGHLAPVRFALGGGRHASPYSLAPWLPAGEPEQQPILQILRGDFFCFPFGAAPGHELIHGETANLPWTLDEHHPASLRASLRLERTGGSIQKNITLRPGHLAVYQEHVISGVEGRYNYGHHPVLEIPEGESVRLRASPFRFGGVYAYPDPDERHAFLSGARFASLDRIPLADGSGHGSLLAYPHAARREDIVMLSARDPGLAWTALTFRDYVWVSLRRTEDFPSTLLWLSNGGRDGAPWRGRHARRVGVEDVYSHFCDGVHVAREDRLRAEGIPTARAFYADVPARLRHIQFVVPVAPDFGGLATLAPIPGGVRLVSESGAIAEASLDTAFLSRAD